MEDDNYPVYDDVDFDYEQAIYGNKDAIIFDDLMRTGRILNYPPAHEGRLATAVDNQTGQPFSVLGQKTPILPLPCEYTEESDSFDEASDFSDSGEEEEENQFLELATPLSTAPQVGALHNSRAVHQTDPDKNSSVRPPLPSPRNQRRQDEDPVYLTPIEVSPKPNLSTIPRRKPAPQPSLPLNSVPWNSRSHTGTESPKPLAKRAPAPLPYQVTSQKKMSPDSTGPHPRVTKLSSLGSPIAENARDRNTFPQRGNQENKSGILSKTPWNMGSAQMSTHNQENNDHVYEIVGTPMTSYEEYETPTSNVPDFGVQNLSSQLGATSISRKKLPATLPGLCRKASDEGNDTNLVQSPISGSSRQNPRHRPPKMVPFACHGRSPHESQAPKELAPVLSSENQPHVKLDDGEVILLTPLYQKIMEMPYFHMISRTKAKTLLANGDNGMFLVRPSTRTGNQLTLTLKEHNRSYNINIRQRSDSLFALGAEKLQEQTFSSVDEMINTYKRQPIKLKNGKTAFLQQTPKKQGSIYVKHHPVGHGKKY